MGGKTGTGGGTGGGPPRPGLLSVAEKGARPLIMFRWSLQERGEVAFSDSVL